MSEFMKLNCRDFIKGFFVAVVAAILAGLMPILESGEFPTVANLKIIGISGLAAGCAYLFKNMITNSNDQIFKGDMTNVLKR